MGSTPTINLFRGDALAVLQTFDDCSVDAIVTDPPYGLSNEPDMAEVLTHWLAGDDYTHTGSGFMGKKWDSFVPGPSVWRECLRVLKPGGHLLCFAGSRTVDLMGISIRLAGFEIRDQLQWLYGSGFPKSQNVSKAIDKAAGAERPVVSTGEPLKRMIPGSDQDRTGSWIKDNGRTYTPTVTEAATDDAARWDGWGTSLKPAHEPIVMARKPLSVNGKKATVAANVLEHGTGAINIDASRVRAASSDQFGGGSKMSKTGDATVEFGGGYGSGDGWQPGSTDGRWPANVILAHHDECLEVGVREVKSNGHHPASRAAGGISTSGHTGQEDLIERKPGVETVEQWDCHDDCAIRTIDAQSGISKSTGGRTANISKTSEIYGGGKGLGQDISADDVRGDPGFGDVGGASRFFYCAKASKSERNAAMADGMKNTHPTVKPVRLMEYLVRLVTPPGGLVLDPFMGSGTTMVAAVNLGFDGVGIDRDDDGEYLPIIQARVRHAGVEPSTVDPGASRP